MNILITGVPGTGKTTLSKRLAKNLGYEHIDLNEIVKVERLWKRKEEGVLVVDMAKLEEIVKRRMGWKNCIVDGHLGCDMKLPVDIVIVVRTSPAILKKRLASRRYSGRKVTTNLLCEALDYCTLKAEENYKDVREIVTHKTVNASLKDIEEILRNENAFKAGKVNWRQELEKLAERSAEIS